ncbi:hypothetical protein D9623_08955 [Azospirillum brasilense]|uniref:MORN repeat protein n=2 Tax=Azospirillum brasilense TaxID=192 RepID=A0A0P0F427_AZOBR|nr:hypothetical protein [Azospirillum brasilense]PWC87150.1 hypothetical protein AEJ54_26250 [Azospirillum sp. Sp 7]ALJ35364.1 hypothetical protein AMK58_07930 [Azospirillum brasilense]MDW7594870.1 hypothetical protein [Azospirillum brasilense]OPH12381.1 hypothetical protein FE89_28640 [Azospirillum brasilense]OPH18428.1 hypothetical protein FE88_25545 [Azospirillum brasilense]
MRTRFLLAGLVALSLGAFLSCPVQGKERQTAERVLTDPVSGCRVHDHKLSPGRSVRWSGPCRNGFAHGTGVLEMFDGAEPADWIEAVFVDGRAEGPGRGGREDGTVFQGRFRHGLATGFGTLTLPEGHRYVGEFAFGRPTGQGEFIASMGLRYRARVDRDGRVWPGALLGAKTSEPIQSAERPDLKGRALPGSLEEWLRTPPWDYRDPGRPNLDGR